MYKQLIRPLLFKFDPEEVHHFTFSAVRLANKIPGFSAICKSIYEVNDPRLEREVFGLKFKNPVGLAAGFDKDGQAIDGIFIIRYSITFKGQNSNSQHCLTSDLAGWKLGA